MRTDVKLGFSIGGVLLAVLIVYVLVISSGPPQRQDAVLVQPDVSPPAGSVPGDSKPAERQAQPIPDPFKTLAPEKSSGTANTATAIKAPPGSAGNKPDDPWSKALHTGKLESKDRVPLLLTQTPEPTDRSANAGDTVSTSGDPIGTDAPEASAAVANAPAPTLSSGQGAQSDSIASLIPGLSPSTQPAVARTSRTHVVQQGETFASIAAAAYGASFYYPHLMRANPNIDPRKLRAGMTINLPDRDDVVAHRADTGSAANSGAAANAAFDEKTHYRVQPNDSLYKISMKLYGKPDRVEKIYELNKDVIGANPAHLKLGMLLKLPEPPARSSSR